MNWFHLLIYITTNLNKRIMYIYTRTLREDKERREGTSYNDIMQFNLNNLNFVIENCINKKKKKKKKKTIIRDIKL